MSLESPKILCLCPTYKRPEMLRNALACFLSQEHINSYLMILDDSYNGQTHQFDEIRDDRFALVNAKFRYDNLPAKFNAASTVPSIDHLDDIDIVAIWEDDDIYLPNHLSSIARMYQIVDTWDAANKCIFFTPKTVYSNYGQNRNGVQIEDAAGRFHGSWAYSIDLWNTLGGYHITDKLIYDQEMGKRARTFGFQVYYDTNAPTYVYRWGSGPWNGSQVGDIHYARFWQSLEDRPIQYHGKLTPEFDKETLNVFDLLGVIVPDV